MLARAWRFKSSRAHQGFLLKPQHRIYLDLDGVIFPYRPETPQQGLTPETLNNVEFYYPTIAQRLGSFVARGVTIMPSSSRSMDLLISYPRVAKDLNGINEYLVIDKEQPAAITYKAEAVLNNWQGVVDTSSERRGWQRQRSMVDVQPSGHTKGSRAVWIDDHIVPAKFTTTRAQEVLFAENLKIIRPVGHIGLTLLQLDEVESFLFSD